MFRLDKQYCFGALSKYVLVNDDSAPLWWLGGVVVGYRTRNRQILGSIPGRDLGQVVHTKVPPFTKQYKLVPCEGFHVDAPYVADMA